MKAIDSDLEFVIIESIVRAINRRRGDPARLKQLARYPELADRLAGEVLDWPRPLKFEDVEMRKSIQFREVLVDYRLCLKELINKTKIEEVDSGISGRCFPRPRRTPEKVVLGKYSFRRHIPAEELFEQIDQTGFEPANIYELVSFCRFYPKDFIRRQWVIALGSLRKKYPSTIGVTIYHWGRHLHIGGYGLYESNPTGISRGDCLLVKKKG